MVTEYIYIYIYIYMCVWGGGVGVCLFVEYLSRRLLEPFEA